MRSVFVQVGFTTLANLAERQPLLKEDMKPLIVKSWTLSELKRFFVTQLKVLSGIFREDVPKQVLQPCSRRSSRNLQ